MKRVVTEADVQALWEELAPIITAEFNASGELANSLIGIRLGAGVGEIAKSIKVPQDIIDLLFSSPHLADLRRNFMRSIITPPPEFLYKGVTADVVLMISEAWYIDQRMSPEDFARAAREGIEGRADRQEAICIIFHTLDGETCGFCPIDPATRKASKGQFLNRQADIPKG